MRVRQATTRTLQDCVKVSVTCISVRQASPGTLQDCVKVSVTCMGVRQASTRTLQDSVKVMLLQGHFRTVSRLASRVRGRFVYSRFLHGCVKVRVWNMCEAG